MTVNRIAEYKMKQYDFILEFEFKNKELTFRKIQICDFWFIMCDDSLSNYQRICAWFSIITYLITQSDGFWRIPHGLINK